MADETTETTETTETAQTTEAAKETADAADKVAETEKTTETETKAAETQADWRAGITSEDGKKFAESSPDLDHLIGRTLALQKQVSVAIIPPGKDADEKEIAAYHKKIGVPETAEGYVFEMPEGREATKDELAFQKAVAQKFHSLAIPADKAAELNAWWNDVIAANDQAQIDADKAFAAEGEAALRKQWPGAEYEKNEAFGNRAAAVIFGDRLEEARHMELKDGRYVHDHPIWKNALAVIGREMAEGGLVPPLSDSDKSQLDDELKGVRDKIAKAQGDGDSKEANRLFQEEQALIAKMQGNQGVVGARGRVA